MRTFTILACALLAAGCATLVRAGRETARNWPRPAPEARDAPRPVRSDHPRLIITNEDIATTSQLIREDALAGRWFRTIQGRATRLMDTPPLDEPRGAMLSTSRQALVRITTLCGVYRITGDTAFAQRAIEEMVTVSRFRDWQPSSFLATAEMTLAVAIGYDWTHGQMSPGEREQIRQAIVTKGLRPGLDAYRTDAGWTTAEHNWNLVCNGGLIVGALAVLDEEPRIANEVLSNARRSIRHGMKGFAPDGAWEEGPTYWNYSTRYASFALAALQTALGDDWGLTRSEGFARTGLFRIHTNGPSGRPFDFADGEPVIGNSAQLHWLARATGNPAYAAFEQAHSEDDPGVFDLLWYRPTDPAELSRLPLNATLRGVELVSLRGSWTDPDTTFVAMKGGSNQAHHGHLDLGTFVLDSLGKRWAVELGADDYDLPDYFGDNRWDYYRCNTRGQNAITLDGRNQDPAARARITRFVSGRDRAHAVLDLGAAWRGHTWRAARGVALLDRTDVLIQDELDLIGAKDVRWAMHTGADVELEDGRTARLLQDGKVLRARIVSPAGARFEAIPLRLARPQKPAEGVTVLAIKLDRARGKLSIAVQFTPGGERPRLVRIMPLSEWPAR